MIAVVLGLLAAPAAPDSVWLHQVDAKRETATLRWTAVPGAEEYRLWRWILVTNTLDAEGRLVELEQPLVAPVPWHVARGVEGEAVMELTFRPGDPGPAVWAISAVAAGEESKRLHFYTDFEGVFEIIGSPEEIPTTVRPRSWGHVKGSALTTDLNP